MILRAIPAAICAAALLSSPAAGQSSRYSSDWRPPETKAAPAPAKPRTPQLHLLLRELDGIATRATGDRAARRRLPADLRALTQRYARHWPRIVLKDPFLDGNLTANPRWIVEAGEFRFGRRGLVIGRRAHRSPGYAESPPPQDDAEPRFGESVIGSLLDELTRDRDSDARAPDDRYDREPVGRSPVPPLATDGEARLKTRLTIPNAFALRVALRSRGNTDGAFVLGVGQGRRDRGYRLAYRPAGTPSLILVRADRRGMNTLGSVFEQIRLEDRKLHKLELARDILGVVTVAVDGRTMLRRRYGAFRDDFDSVLLHVTGGAYVVRGVVVVGSP